MEAAMTDMNVTLVVKKHPDGYNYVPFDHDPHPSRQAIVDAYISALVQEGHELEIVHGFDHHGGVTHEDGRSKFHPLDFHLKLKSGPRSHLGEQK
jgi:hypothetical protein